MIGDQNNIDNDGLRLDDLDLKIITSLVAGKPNRTISDELKVPLSTIQRRTRRMFEKKAVEHIIQPNFSRLGLRKGVVHLYINNVDALATCQKLLEITGVTSVSVHIGNSDIVGNIIYRHSSDVLDIIANCKRIEGVVKVVWSEEVYNSISNTSNNKIIDYFKRS